MPGRGHARAWAEEVEEEEEAASPIYDETSGQYRGSESAWHEGIAVERGSSKHRLDTGHGFYRSIVSGFLRLSFDLKEPVPQRC